MTMPLLEVQIKDWELSKNVLRVNYLLTSRSATPIFLVEDQRFPFLRLTVENTTLEIWQGVPPLSEPERNKLINALILPNTSTLAPGAMANRTTIVEWPLKQSGYWLEESEKVPMSLGTKAEGKALIVQGFGSSAIDPQRVHSIDQLFAWQLTARSQVVTFKLPPAAH